MNFALKIYSFNISVPQLLVDNKIGNVVNWISEVAS